MADRYWVPSAGSATGTWNTTNTANWATSSGGGGGASVPTSTDNVIFDANSNVTTEAFTVTLSGAVVCANFDCTGVDGLFTLSSTLPNGLSVYGSWANPASSSLFKLSTCNITFAATSGSFTIDSKANTAVEGYGGYFIINGGATYTLSSALSIYGIKIEAGTFTTNNFAVSCYTFSSIGTLTRILNLGSSTITTKLTGTAVDFTNTGITLNPGTSTFTDVNNIKTFNGAGLTFANASWSVDTTINGTNTWTNLTFNNTGGPTMYLGANQTVTGTFTISSSSSGPVRVNLISSIAGTQYTVTAAAVSLKDINFQDTIGAGAAAPFTGTRLGDMGNNSGITFPAAKTVYLVGTTSVDYYSTAWATSSGGATSGFNYPLPQDTAVIDNNSVNSSANISCNTANLNLGGIDCSTRTNPMSLVLSSYGKIYGNLIGASGVTFSAASIFYFSKRGTQTVNLNGGTFSTTNSVYVLNITGTTQLTGNFTLTASTFQLFNGTLDLNNYTLTTPYFNSNSTSTITRTLAFGTSGKIIVTGDSNILLYLQSSGLITTGSKNVEANAAATSGTRTFTQTGLTEAQVLNVKVTAGSDTIVSANTNTLDFTGFTGTWSVVTSAYVYGNLTLNSSMTVSSALSTLYFAATTGSKTFTTANKTFNSELTFGTFASSATWTLVGDLTVSGTINLTYGNLNSNGYSVTTGAFTSSNLNTRSLTMGASTWTITGASPWTLGSSSMTLSAGTSTINLTSAASKFFYGAGFTYYNVVQAGLGTLTIVNNNKFNNLSNTVQPTQITFTSGSTQTFTNFSLSGTASNLVTLAPSSTTNYTLSAPSGTVINRDYLSISRSTATGGAAWYAGGNSTNGGNNSGWVFTSAPTIIFVTSVTGTTAVGTVSVGLGTTFSVTKVTGTGSIGTVNFLTDQIFSVTKVTGTTALGSVNVQVATLVTGVDATGFTGTVSFITNQIFSVTNVTGTTAVGTVDVSLGATVFATKVTGTTALGTVSVVFGNTVSVTGVQATGSINSVSLVTTNFIPVTGVFATGRIGVTTITSPIADPKGVQGIGRIGNIAFSSSVTFSVTGVYGTALLNTGQQTTVTGVSGTTELNYVVLSIWSAVDDYQNSTWVDIPHQSG